MSIYTEMARDRLDRLTMDEQSVVAQDREVMRTHEVATSCLERYQEVSRATLAGSMDAGYRDDVLNGLRLAQNEHAKAILNAQIKHRDIPFGMSVLNIPGMAR
jgi:hypothetical protein